MVIGFLRVELHLPMALSLKDKRSILKSVKDRLRGQFNLAIAELEPNEKWQRASLGMVTLGNGRRAVDRDLSYVTEWIRAHQDVDVIRIEQELL